MAAPKSNDELEIIHVGATISQLSVIFDLPTKIVKEKIIGKVASASLPHRTPALYAIRQAAPHLCKVEVNIEEAIKNIPPSKLPPMLQAPFWAAQRDKLKYMEDVGRLWSSERVIEILGEVYKPLRMTILMMQETVAQKTELNETQRQVIVDITDKLLADLHEKLVEHFKDYRPKDDEHGPPLDGTEALDVEEEEDDGLND